MPIAALTARLAVHPTAAVPAPVDPAIEALAAPVAGNAPDVEPDAPAEPPADEPAAADMPEPLTDSLAVAPPAPVDPLAPTAPLVAAVPLRLVLAVAIMAFSVALGRKG